MKSAGNTSHGFTMVELLIAISIMGVLAGLSLTSFSSFQERSRNTQTITAANKWHEALLAYMVSDESIPIAPNEHVCLGEGYPDVDSNGIGDCRNVAVGSLKHEEKSVFNDELRQYISGKLPLPSMRPVTKGDSQDVGAYIGHDPSLVIDGVSRPYYFIFSLEGSDEDCRVPGVVRADPAWPIMSEFNAKNSGYWASTEATNCIVSLPAPN